MGGLPPTSPTLQWWCPAPWRSAAAGPGSGCPSCPLGIDLACVQYPSGNLCGLFGFIVIGPLASSLAIVLASSLMTLTDREPSARPPPSKEPTTSHHPSLTPPTDGLAFPA